MDDGEIAPATRIVAAFITYLHTMTSLPGMPAHGLINIEVLRATFATGLPEGPDLAFIRTHLATLEHAQAAITAQLRF